MCILWCFQYNTQLLTEESPAKRTYSELILEKTKDDKIVVEVDRSLVRRLKPHQVSYGTSSSFILRVVNKLVNRVDQDVNSYLCHIVSTAHGLSTFTNGGASLPLCFTIL